MINTGRERLYPFQIARAADELIVDRNAEREQHMNCVKRHLDVVSCDGGVNAKRRKFAAQVLLVHSGETVKHQHTGSGSPGLIRRRLRAHDGAIVARRAAGLQQTFRTFAHGTRARKERLI